MDISVSTHPVVEEVIRAKANVALRDFRRLTREKFAAQLASFQPCPEGHTRTWMNVYHSGHWHTAGKPGAFDFHGGDNYRTWEGAIDAIERPHLYICTAPIDLPTSVLQDHCVVE